MVKQKKKNYPFSWTRHGKFSRKSERGAEKTLYFSDFYRPRLIDGKCVQLIQTLFNKNNAHLVKLLFYKTCIKFHQWKGGKGQSWFYSKKRLETTLWDQVEDLHFEFFRTPGGFRRRKRDYKIETSIGCKLEVVNKWRQIRKDDR